MRDSTLLGLAALLCAACGDDDLPATDDAGASATDAGVDAGPDAGPPPPDDVCTELGLPRDDLRADSGGVMFGDVAGDFTVNTTDGPWTLSEEHTGCESYVFLVYFDSTYGQALWRSVPDPLVDVGPRNVHYFFVSFEEDTTTRMNRVQQMRTALDEGFDFLELPPERREAELARFHFVTDRLVDIEGSVGAFASDYIDYLPSSAVDLGDRGSARAPAPFVFGIDREQRWDSGGSLDEFVGGQPRIAMAAYLGHFYNHKAALRHRLASEAATEIPLVEGSVTDRIFTPTVTVPALDDFDTLELEVEVFCPHRNVFGCSEWDRIARVSVCTDGAECAERLELARWITPYWRRGRRHWVIDASPMLHLLESGEQTFHVEMGPGWERATEREVRVALRLRSADRARAIGGALAFRGGTFDAAYNEGREPFSFTPPADASRVELVTVLSGHGQSEGANCAEWCDHRHRFEVNGEALEELVSDPGIGSPRGCAEAAAGGLPPGQFGNWAPQRAYWCPGLPVDAERIDITERVTLGSENSLTYAAAFRDGEAPAGGNIDLSAYVVWYE